MRSGGEADLANVFVRPAYWPRMQDMEAKPGLDALLAQAGWLRALAVVLVRHGADADDAVQDVWTAALRSPPQAGRPARPWLAQVLRNVVRSGIRRRRRRWTHEAEAASLAPAEATPAAETALERMQLHRRVAELLVELDEPYRTTLILRFYEGRAAGDIARAEGVADGTIRWRINEGVRRLRERLDRDCGERWIRVLLPLARADRGRGGRVLRAAGLTSTVGAVAVWIAVSLPTAKHTRPALEPGGPASEEPTKTPAAPRPATESEADTMRQARMKQTAALFGVVLPALGAVAADNESLRREAVDACVEMDEKAYECRDVYTEARAASQVPLPEKRARLRDLDVREMNERAGSGERRRQWCQQRSSQMEPADLQKLKAILPKLRACYPEKDCAKRVDCMLDVLDPGKHRSKQPPRR
jgi:RNA polymerase sigma factor (sigma-70 family)